MKIYNTPTKNKYSKKYGEAKIHIIHKTIGKSFYNKKTGVAGGALGWLMGKFGNKGSSAHFVIHRNGDVFQLVALNERSWHSGISKARFAKIYEKASRDAQIKMDQLGKNPNMYSIGYEFEALINESYTEAQKKAFLDLVEHIGKTYPALGLENLEDTLFTHNNFVHYKPMLDKEKAELIKRAGARTMTGGAGRLKWLMEKIRSMIAELMIYFNEAKEIQAELKKDK